MPTKRMITPAFWQSESIARLTPLQRLLFIGLFSNADDQGRLRGHPALIRSLIFPYDNITNEEIESDLKAIEATGAIVIYEKESKHCIQVTGWWKYQSPQWAYPSDLPPYDGWCDQLRYRQNNRVITQNWKGEDDIINEEPLGKALPKDQGKALVSSPIEIDIELGLDSELESLSNDNGATAPPTFEPEVQEPKTPDGQGEPVVTKSELEPANEQEALLFELLKPEFKAKGHRPPKKFPSLACKRKYVARAKYLGDNTGPAIERALQKGIASVTGIVDFIAKWNPENENKARNNGHETSRYKTPTIDEDAYRHLEAQSAAAANPGTAGGAGPPASRDRPD